MSLARDSKTSELELAAVTLIPAFQALPREFIFRFLLQDLSSVPPRFVDACCTTLKDRMRELAGEAHRERGAHAVFRLSARGCFFLFD